MCSSDLDDLGNYDDAFSHYRQGNDLEQRQANFDRDQHRQLVDWMIATFTAEFFAAHKDVGITNDKPVSIVGMPRSGTTLTEQIVASHSKVHGGGEIDYWLEHGETFCPPNGQDLSQGPVRELARVYLDSIESVAGSAMYFTDKMPYNFLRIGLIRLAMPGAKFIHCMRNPADICLSIYFNKFTQRHGYATSLDDLAFYYREYLRLMEHWRQVLPETSLHEMHYESLVAMQESESRRLIDFLGLEWESQVLEYHRNTRAVSTPSKWQVRQPIYKSSVARWKRYLPHIGPLAPLAEAYEQSVNIDEDAD